ncbi:MAG: TlpA family protein disulfide reductase [Bacteroidales bacterium]|nr:TlpA family protein disulfide reductase [Bacteroidales bacterium]
MIEYFRKKWIAWKTRKSITGKISDVVFVMFLIAMLIPASRREISAFMIRIISVAPEKVKANEQKFVTADASKWQLISLEGEAFQFSDFAGKPIFINFWATWCPPCVAELPEIMDLYLAYRDDVVFLLITDESPETVRAFMKQKNYDLPVYFIQSSTPEIFGTSTIPATFVVSPDNKIVIEKRGAAKWNSKPMHKLLDEMVHK